MSVSTPIVRELFRNLETTIHERLSIIEELLRNDGSMEKSMQIQRPDPAVLDRLSKLEASSAESSNTINTIKHSLDGLFETVVDLSRMIRRLEASHTAVAPAVEDVQQEIAHREVSGAAELAEAEAAEVDEEEQEEEEEEEEEEVEEEVEEEEEEGEELELEEFVYKRNGKTYYRDQNNNVYQDDEDGNLIDTPVGVWNATKERIHPLSK